MTAPEKIAEDTFLERLWHKARRAQIEAMQTDEDRRFLRGLHEDLGAKAKERDAKKKIGALSERRKHPADPRASSITAAVAAESTIFEGMRYRLRPVENDGQRAFRAYDFEDVGVLFTVLHLLESSDRVHVRNVATSPVFADSELPREPYLGRSLANLRKRGWLEATFENGDGFYTYGPRVRKIAAKWGIEITEATKLEDEKEAAEATA